MFVTFKRKNCKFSSAPGRLKNDTFPVYPRVCVCVCRGRDYHITDAIHHKITQQQNNNRVVVVVSRWWGVVTSV